MAKSKQSSGVFEAFNPIWRSSSQLAVQEGSAKRSRGRPRKVSATPAEPLTIKVNYGGLWMKSDGEPPVYADGSTAWIHVKDRMQFGYGELMRAVMGRVTGPLPQGCFWFRSNGCKIPGALVPLENTDDMKVMYMVVCLAKETCSEVYVQEAEVIYSTNKPFQVFYELPDGIEKMDTTKRYNWFELSRMILIKEKEELEKDPNERNWFVSTTAAESRRMLRNLPGTNRSSEDLYFIWNGRW